MLQITTTQRGKRIFIFEDEDVMKFDLMKKAGYLGDAQEDFANNKDFLHMKN